MNEQKKLITLGQLTDLERERELWTFEGSGRGFHGYTAYLDAATGDLIFLWLHPEL